MSGMRTRAVGRRTWTRSGGWLFVLIKICPITYFRKFKDAELVAQKEAGDETWRARKTGGPA